MRRIRTLVLILVVLLFAAACGDAESTTVVEDGADGDAGVARSVSPAALLAQAAEQPVTGIEMTMAMEIGGFPEFGGSTLAFGALVATSADGSASRMVLDMGDMMEAAASASGEELPPEMADFLASPVEIREIDGTAYMSAGFFSWLFPVDTPWLSFAAEDSTTTGFDTDSVDPESFVAVLRALGDDVEVVGVEDIDGVATTHLRGRLTEEGLAAIGEDDFFADLDFTETGTLDLDAVDFDVWVREEGGVRRMVMGLDDIGSVDPTAPEGSFFRMTVDIVELDGTVDIVAPPAADVTAMDDLFALGFDE